MGKLADFFKEFKPLTEYLSLGYFCLMGLGLLLASYFLQTDKLTGSEWVMLCSILFASDRAATALGGFKNG